VYAVDNCIINYTGSTGWSKHLSIMI